MQGIAMSVRVLGSISEQLLQEVDASAMQQKISRSNWLQLVMSEKEKDECKHWWHRWK
jgi:hypothetical protein